MKAIPSKWKNKNDAYLNELQYFFDALDNLEDEELRSIIRYHGLKCNEIVTELAENMFAVYYLLGVKVTQEGYKNEKINHTTPIGNPQKEKKRWGKKLLWG